MDERSYWLGFSLFSGIGPKKFHQLIITFGSAKNAWTASEKDFEQIAKPAITRKFFVFKETGVLESYQAQLEKKKAWFVTLNDAVYSDLLRKSYNPPFVLFGIGDQSVLAQANSLGIVGTRKITSYGRQVTEMITRELVAADYCIISGLAMGVDAVAHAAALNAGGKTIAVLGCGVDCCNPLENERLYHAIIESGSTIVSEYALGIAPTIGSFPSRNRIIAGLSQGIVVTEGAADSGALITAHDSFTNNRPVFAVPGPITSSLSKGPNELLRKGGKLVTSGEDILRELGNERVKSGRNARKIVSENKEEQIIIELLRNEELQFDELCQKSLITTAKLNMLLSLMEMKGFVRLTDQGRYMLLDNL